MAEEGKAYACEIFAQEVKFTKGGIRTLVCCDQPMAKKKGIIKGVR